jgi:hypothetical protein
MNEQHKAWAMQWKSAAPRLQAVRDEELRSLESTTRTSQNNLTQNPEMNGLVIFQKWMMRRAILQAAKIND